MAAKLTKVFVYGTLKPGEGNYQRLCFGRVVEEQEAYTFGELYHLNPGYPGMTPGKNQVRGFVLTFPELEVLRDLDYLEDYNPQAPLEKNEYYRQEIEVYDLSGKSLGTAWAYFMTLAKVKQYQGRLLSSGFWHRYTTQN